MSDPTKCIHGRNFCLECHSTAGESSMFQQLEICQKQRDNAQSQLAALREELATLKAPGPLCFCGLKQTKNPHPEAGVPPGYLEVGTVYDCIPCLNKSRRAWSKKANALTSELAETQQRLAEAERRNAEYVELLVESRRNLNLHAMDYKHPGQHKLIAKIDAALNPNPEATSHDE